MDLVILVKRLWKLAIADPTTSMQRLPSPPVPSRTHIEDCLQNGYIDNLSGRTIGCDFSNPSNVKSRYNEINGDGLFEQVLDTVRLCKHKN